jgi:hypothetical protein
MESFTIALERGDIERLKRISAKLRIPPHVMARSMLLRQMDVEILNWEQRTGGSM